MKILNVIGLGVAVCLWWTLPAAAQMDAQLQFEMEMDMGDPAELVFGQCMECHSFSEDGRNGRFAPNLWGVIGRTAGTAVGFDYSPALRDSGIVWTESNIDRWLRDPQAMVPGTRSVFSLGGTQEREYALEFIRNGGVAEQR